MVGTFQKDVARFFHVSSSTIAVHSRDCRILIVSTFDAEEYPKCTRPAQDQYVRLIDNSTYNVIQINNASRAAPGIVISSPIVILRRLHEYNLRARKLN
jgi:hypothetical protein